MKPETFRKVIAVASITTLSAACSLAQQPGTVRWRVPIGASLQGPVSSPAIGADGTIYVGNAQFYSPSTGTNLYAISPQGTTNWIFRTGGDVRSSPSIGPDGTIYVGSLDTRLYAISPAGKTNWAFATGGKVYGSPAVGADGTIYVAATTDYYTNRLYAVRPNGTTNWVFKMGTPYPLSAAPSPSPAIGPDGTIYTGSADSSVYSISPNGATNWVFASRTYSSAALGPDGTIFFGGEDHKLHALNRQGVQSWEFPTGSYVESSAAIGSDGRIYFSSIDQRLYALDPSGTLLWTNAGFSSSPALAADGTVYSVSWSGSSLYAISQSGSTLWTAALSDVSFSSPAIGPDGTVYVLGSAYLWAIHGSSPPQEGPWPMFRRNAQHTARSLQCGISPPSILSNGTATLTCRVETGRVYRVSASSDLVTWTGLGTFTSNTNLTQFLDFDAPNFPQRFYRLATP
jgi:outer membrane protein assembly factor BamB